MGSYHAPKNAPRTGCIFAPATNPQPKPFQPTSSPSMQRNTHKCGVAKQCGTPNNAAPKCGVAGKCGVTKQGGAKQCGAKMWRHRKMWRRQTMWRQTMRRRLSSKCVFIMCLQRQVQKWTPFFQHREILRCLGRHFPSAISILKFKTYQNY